MQDFVFPVDYRYESYRKIKQSFFVRENFRLTQREISFKLSVDIKRRG